MRSTSRLADVSINTVTKLLVEVGKACEEYQYMHLRNLQSKRIQVDEIWSFCYAKQKNLPDAKNAPEVAGDVWTWTALDADSRLIVTWLVGNREMDDCRRVMRDLADRLTTRVELISDGYSAYIAGVESAFGGNIHFGQIVKSHTKDELVIEKRSIIGNPINISTSLIERQNLTIRTTCKRYARRTNAHSKKIQNHNYAIALHFMYYNFAKIHTTLRVTPAMQAGISSHVWSLEEIIALCETTV